jgi:transcriptional regulator with XRE-family HTH domain
MFAMMPTRPRKPEQLRRARRLRRQGLSIKKIAAELGVSPSSVCLWTRDIVLTPEQTAANLIRGGEHLRMAAAARSAICSAKRSEAQEAGRLHARKGDHLHLVGCMLYWAEGRKDRNTIQFSNSDPHMAVLFRRFMTEALGIDCQRIRFTLNVYTNNGMTIEEIERRWLELLDLPPSCVRKHTLNHMPTSSSGRAKNKLPYGVCTLRVHNTWMLQHIYGAIQEYGGFDEPAWLH